MNIANTKIGLNPNNSVIKRLWCLNNFVLTRKNTHEDNIKKMFEVFCNLILAFYYLMKVKGHIWLIFQNSIF